MKILLTGGMGFIGSHTAVVLQEAGHIPVLFDNLSNAAPSVVERIERITRHAPKFIEGDIRDGALLEKVLREEAMRATGVKRLIFSSSSTVYGTPAHLPIKESDPTGEATNPYGRTKLMIEEMLSDLCHADPAWSVVCLRYFNPIGAHPSGLIGDDPNGIPNNLLPYVSRVANGRLPYLNIFGNDYDTPDGTGVRDYIHVMDLARGHAAALPYCMSHEGWKAVNLGCGRGYSVLEIVAAFEMASGRKVPVKFAPRRAGDIAANWCDPTLARDLFGWEAKLTIDDMCRDAWNFESRQASMGCMDQ